MRRLVSSNSIVAIPAACILLTLVAAGSNSAWAYDVHSLRFQHLSRDAGLSQSFVYAIVQDRQGFMRFGTQEGLNRFDDYDFIVFANDPADPGSISDTSNGTIVADRSGTLWIGTDAGGLSKLDIDTLTFRNFLASHSLQGEEFNLAAALRSADGQLFFGGVRGFNAIYPEQLNFSTAPPQVAITQFSSLNMPINLGTAPRRGDQLELNHDQYVVGFRFAALDFAEPGNNRFAYKLEGLDEDWIDAGTKRDVTYTNLAWGDYTFRVKASNSEGVWSEQDAVLELYMRPAPWNTWFAWLAYLALAVLIIAILYRTHSRKIRQVAKLKHADELAVIQSRLNEAQRIAGLGNWEWDTVTNELWWSDEIYRLFQLSPEQFEGTYEAFLERVHPDDRAAVDRAVQRTLAGKETYSIDHRILRADGSAAFVHERGEVFFDDRGTPIRMAGTIHDVSERQKAEEDSKRRAGYQALLAGLSSDLIQARPDEIDEQLRDAIRLIGLHFDLDTVSLWWFANGPNRLEVLARWSRSASHKYRLLVNMAETPWVAKQLLSCKPVVVADVEQLSLISPEESKRFHDVGLKSFLMIPLCTDGQLLGACAFNTVREARQWPSETISELQLVAHNLLSAVARSKTLLELERLKQELQEENLYLREEVRLVHGFSEIVGEDRRLRECLKSVEKVAPTDVAVLLLGETGTGKELFARAVHKLSSRRDAPMISVNCPALPAELIESELFGHEKGAFTGAQARRRGRFELAEKGTIFLDEIGELPLELQSKLLRVLQTGGFERLGGTETLFCDVRLIAATNKDLFVAQQRGEFRSDLYYRISSFPINLPPLRERCGDIPLLAEHFVRKHAKRLDRDITAISVKMIRELEQYSWPGNVRELESIIERALISGDDGSILELNDALPKPGRIVGSRLVPHGEDVPDLDSVERSHIIRVLEGVRWKISGSDGAAAMLSVPPSTLRSKMKRLGILRRRT